MCVKQQEKIGRCSSQRSFTTSRSIGSAPHTSRSLAEEWDHPYDRVAAAFPVGVHAPDKYWPPVARIDGAYGDRHLVCSCPPPEAFED